MKLARLVYAIAGIYGILVLLPGFFLLERVGRDMPPAVTHPEYYYGFYGVTLVWQFAFLLISRDPARYRPLMPITVLEKAAWVVTVGWLASAGLAAAPVVLLAAIDALLGVLFAIAYLRTASSSYSPKTETV